MIVLCRLVHNHMLSIGTHRRRFSTNFRRSAADAYRVLSRIAGCGRYTDRIHCHRIPSYRHWAPAVLLWLRSFPPNPLVCGIRRGTCPGLLHHLRRFVFARCRVIESPHVCSVRQHHRSFHRWHILWASARSSRC